jgi:hypothetical protein
MKPRFELKFSGLFLRPMDAIMVDEKGPIDPKSGAII